MGTRKTGRGQTPRTKALRSTSPATKRAKTPTKAASPAMPFVMTSAMKVLADRLSEMSRISLPGPYLSEEQGATPAMQAADDRFRAAAREARDIVVKEELDKYRHRNLWRLRVPPSIEGIVELAVVARHSNEARSFLGMMVLEAAGLELRESA